MRFIGGKSLMLDHIISAVKNNAANVNIVVDLFSGSGVVASFFKEQGYRVYANDIMYFSYILNRGSICLNKKPDFSILGIKDPVKYLNNLKIEDTNISLTDCFIYNNYSPNETCDRMYFQNDNAIKIDIIRLTIETWYHEKQISEDEYFYLLAALISAVPFVSNITGVYAAYLKHWDDRTYNPLELKEISIIKSRKKHLAFHQDANELVKSISADLVYIDPPYNERQYLPNYHILETISKYDNPEIKGITGMRDYSDEKSKYCQKSSVITAFDDLIHSTNSKYILVSYNNEGLLSTDELSTLFKKHAKDGSFCLIEYGYRRYKNKIPNHSDGLKEQLYFFEKGKPNEKTKL